MMRCYTRQGINSEARFSVGVDAGVDGERHRAVQVCERNMCSAV